MKKIRIITYHFSTNNGAFLQAKSTQDALKKILTGHDVKIINYKAPSLKLYERLKFFRLYKKSIFFNIRRYLIFKKTVKKFIDLDPILRNDSWNYLNQVKEINSSDIDVLITGSDCIWRLKKSKFLPDFPNIYWFSDRIRAEKISYAASAYKSDPVLFKENSLFIGKIVNSFKLISVRDEETRKLLLGCGIKKDIMKIPDPTFQYEIIKTNVGEKLEKLGLDLSKPIFAILSFGENYKIGKIVDYFRGKKYQIVSLSMYNPYADTTLGDKLDPLEWAEVFKYIEFCVTDRFHGTIFCMKNKTPFISIESPGLTQERSKKYQVLKDMNMLDSYLNLYEVEYTFDKFKNKAVSILNDWEEKYVPAIDKGLKKMKYELDEFNKKIKQIVDKDY